jgi:hypothetical protein
MAGTQTQRQARDAQASACHAREKGNMTAKATRAIKRAFDILLPRLNRATAGGTFAAGNYVRRTGVVPALLEARRLHGGSIGVHATEKGGSHSLCALPLASTSKDATARLYKAGRAENVAPFVTCKFCAARLVAAGLLTAETIGSGDGCRMSSDDKAYALDYGSRSAVTELAAIESREAAAKRQAAKAQREAAAKRAAAKAAKAAAQ